MNWRGCIIKFALSMLLLVVMTSSAALAAGGSTCVTSPIPKPPANTGNFELGTCAFNHTGVNYLPHEVTQKFVACMQGTIVDSVLDIMNVISIEFSWLTGALATLVIMFYGVRVVTGERELLERTATLMIKLGVVVTMMAYLPALVGAVFSGFSEILTWVTGGVSPWAQMDIFIGKLLGFGATITMMNGLLGVVVAAAFSSSVGVMAAFSGVMAIMNLLLFLMNLVYTYCLAFLTLGFLLLLAPVIIPMHLFFYTKEYFTKWFNIMAAAILTPTLLFAFCYMFLGIFDVLIQQILDVLGGNDFSSYWRMNTSLFSWMLPSDANMNFLMKLLPSTTDDVCGVEREIMPPVQTYINPLMKNAFDAAMMGQSATLDFGADDVNTIQSLTAAFVKVWLFSSLMKAMIQLIPEIASSIASVGTQIAFGNSTVLGQVKEGMDKLQKVQTSGQSATGGVKNIVKQVAQMSGKRDK